MTDMSLIPLLALGTMILVIGFALWSKRATENRMKNDSAEKSSLAKDGSGPRPFR